MDRLTKFTIPALTAAAALALSGCGGTGSAQGGGEAFTAPDNVRMIVPFGAGGGSDLAGRATAKGLEEVIGSTVTVENITGGDGAVGYAELMASKGDAGTLLSSETALVSLPIVQDVEFSYKDFTPIMKLGEDYSVVMVSADSPYGTCKDLVDAAKQGEVTTGVAGASGIDSVTWGLIEDKYDVNFQSVVFESGAEIVTAVMGGHVDAGMTNPGEVLGQIESGGVKALCVLAPERYEYEELADVPTGVEQGVDVSFAQWRGIVAPGGISEEARQYWIEQGKAFAKTSAYTEYVESNLLQKQVAYGDEFVEYLEKYHADLESVLGKQ